MSRQPDEEAPIGLILCAESSRKQVELPPKAELEQRLQAALVEARGRLARPGVLLAGGRG